MQMHAGQRPRLRYCIAAWLTPQSTCMLLPSAGVQQTGTTPLPALEQAFNTICYAMLDMRGFIAGPLQCLYVVLTCLSVQSY